MKEDTARAFFEALWGSLELEREHYFLLWLKARRKKLSLWFQDIGDVARAAVGRRLGNDCYTAVCVSPKDFGPNKRCVAGKALAVAGLWADLDFGPNHKKKALEDEDAAWNLLTTTGKKPSLVIHSAHGLQPWWLFDEPLVFESNAERQGFEKLSKGWIKYLSALANLKLDQVGDLARILRIPGTLNHKNKDSPEEVRLVVSDGPRWSLDPFRECVDGLDVVDELSGLSEPSSSSNGEDTSKASLSRSFAAESDPSFDRFIALCDLEPKFRASWEHRRRDLDTSDSGYELSLASLAMRAGWKDDEIARLIIAHRRKWDPSRVEKVVRTTRDGRQDYLELTISRARQGLGTTERKVIELAEIEGFDPPDEETAGGGGDEGDGDGEDGDGGGGDRRRRLAKLSELFRIDATGVRKVGQENPVYYLGISNEWVLIGGVSSIGSWNKFQESLLRHNVVIGTLKAHQWRVVLETLLLHPNVLDEVDNPEDCRAARTLGWIEDYLRRASVASDEGFFDALVDGTAFARDGYTWFSNEELRSWVRDRRGEKPTAHELGARLREANVAHKRFDISKDGKRASGWRWGVPSR